MSKIIEYVITLKNEDDVIFDNKADADVYFDSVDKKKVHQYYRKDWIMVDKEYHEDYVDLYYNE